MKIVATVNFKGGVGKTTITWLLAKMAALENKKVLVIDADAQMSLTTALSIDEGSGQLDRTFEKWYEEKHKRTGRTLLYAIDAYDKWAKGQCQHFDFPVDNNLTFEVLPNLHFIPSTEDLYWMELQMFNPSNVKGFISAFSGKLTIRGYDIVFFDCPPSFTLLSYSVLSNCSLILVPTNPDVFAVRGLRIMMEGLRGWVQPWPEPKIAVFMNRARGRYAGGHFSAFNETDYFYRQLTTEANSLSKQNIAKIDVLKTLIPERAGVRQAISFGGFPVQFRQEFQSLWNEVKALL
jgi:chromosome partitioning protein